MKALHFATAVGLSALHAQTGEEIFRSVVQPVLARDCQGCHGAQQALSRLDLQSRTAALRGGLRGPAVVPGDPKASLLMRAVQGIGVPRMPPGEDSKRLPAEVIAAFRSWIEAGAPWPESGAAANVWGNFREEDLWAFRPLRKRDPSRSIDDYLSAALAAKGLRPAPAAEKAALIRRVSIDLTGLPPAAEEVDAFVADSSPDAWRKVVDRLLASPRYGERWGRHWLDVVRYADTGGYSNDFERPNAWRYRDYVIRSFNRDKPYDRFILEQVAGDELFPGDVEALIATGFLRAGPWEHTAMSVEAVTRQMWLDDVTNATGVTFLGLTLGCARCHDHKFDPIPTRDYYRFQAAFASTEFARPPAPFLPEENTSRLEYGKAHMQRVVAQTQANISRFDDLVKQHLVRKHGVADVNELPKEVVAKAVREREGVGAAQFEELKLYQKHMQLYKESLDRFEPKAFAVSSGPLDGATDGGPNLRYPKRSEYKAPEVRVLPGGNIQSPADPVTPGLIAAVERYSGFPAPPVPEGVAGRRSALARWIADPRNPLTARVMVNRVWQYHFGRGLAADANNFGKMGRKPSHPELLDALAADFIASGWSVKALHRAILMSEAYRRSSSHPAMAVVRERDPDNELLSYFPPRRVEAETLRDAILAVSGELSPEAGGPGAFPQINEDVARQPLHRMGSLAPAYHASARKRDRNRRSVYNFQQRSLADPMIEAFNGPNMDVSCERREAATVPTQAFTLFNGQFVHDIALAFAARVEREAASVEGRVDRMFRRAFGRAPEATERRKALDHVARMTALHRALPPPPKPEKKPLIHQITSELTGEQHSFLQQSDPEDYEENLHPSAVGPQTRALADLALVLFNSNEFIYVY